MNHGFHHVAIATQDIERAADLYKDLPGYETVFKLNGDSGKQALDATTGRRAPSARIVMLTCGNAVIKGLEYHTPQPRPDAAARAVCDHGLTHLGPQVTDNNAAHTRLKAAGIPFHNDPRTVGGGLWATYGRGPDGNVVELLVTPRDSALAVVAA